jgi:hypothetical protein
MTVADDGGWDFGEIECGGDSYCVCDHGDHDGIVHDFQTEERS